MIGKKRKVLILGGTSEGFALADALCALPHIQVMSSLAGRVAQPRLPVGEVRIGGFGGSYGLAVVLRAEGIDAVVDATHPFATKIKEHAKAACRFSRVPLLALLRPPWITGPGDDWRDASNVEKAACIAASIGERIFVTVGRQNVAAFAPYDRHFVFRTIDPPLPPLPRRYELVMRRGPFTLDEERRLLQDYAIEVVVSKNSGGDGTSAKLVAARERNIPVVMVSRPAVSDVQRVSSVEEALAWTEALT